jgi:hypothetical protein
MELFNKITNMAGWLQIAARANSSAAYVIDLFLQTVVTLMSSNHEYKHPLAALVAANLCTRGLRTKSFRRTRSTRKEELRDLSCTFLLQMTSNLRVVFTTCLRSFDHDVAMTAKFLLIARLLQTREFNPVPEAEACTCCSNGQDHSQSMQVSKCWITE